MTTIPTSSIDAALRRAYSTRDAAALASLYAEDATIEIVDAVHTPSHPLVLSTQDAVRAHIEDVFGRDMSHEVDIAVVTAEAIGYSVRCAYPDGTKVVCVATAALHDGRIVREVGVQAWDS
jgi:ketosteroid isomerase-like protein